MARAYPARFAVKLAYDDALAHRIEAGADIFLMPSRYEPCGLSQIYSLRYGTVPVVRATGGLDDTIDRTTGFKFKEYSAGAMLTALRSALEMYADPDWLEDDDAQRHGSGLLLGGLRRRVLRPLQPVALASGRRLSSSYSCGDFQWLGLTLLPLATLLSTRTF